MKRFWTILLTLCMLFTQENLMVLAATMDDGVVVASNATTGTLGMNNGFQWTYEEATKTLTVTGEDSDLVPLDAINSPFLQIDPAMEKIVFQDCIFRGSLRYLMSGLTNLLNVEFNHCDTSEVTDMSFMFYECVSLGTLDVSSFDTGNVTDMSFMFSVCRNLTDLDVSTFDTSNVTSMMHMFSYCTNLKTLNVSGFDTGKVTNMAYMFSGCENLTSLNLSHFKTSQVTSMAGMFDMCTTLERLDVSSFDTSNVTDMSLMIRNCSNLQNLNVSGFDTSNVTNMNEMFAYCYGIKEIDLSSFDMSNVTSANDMLTLVDGIGFDKILTPNSIAEGIKIQLPGTYRDESGNIITELTSKNCNTVLTEMVLFENVGVTIGLSEWSYTYTGKACEPVVEFTVDGVVLKKDIDYTVSYENNINVGTATVIVTGKGNYLGTARCEFPIYEAPISDAKVTLSTTSYTYNGKAKKPEVTVKIGDSTLKEGVDYTVAYKNNKNIGTATVIITGKGNYSDSVEKTFTIKAKKDTVFTYGKYNYKVTSSSTVAFAGIASDKTVKVVIPTTVKYGGKTFKVTSIAANALKKKTKVTSVTISSSIKEIGKNAFYGCKNLKTITINTEKLTKINTNAFKGINKNATIKVPTKKYSSYVKLLKDKGQGSKVSIVINAKKGDTFTSGNNKYEVLSSSAVKFTGLKNAKKTSVSIPKTIKYGGKTFKVTIIADKALKGNKTVKKVTIGENIKEIGANAFNGCSKLKTITINTKKLEKVGKNALKGIYSKATIKVPKSKFSAYKKLLKSKGQGKKVEIVKY